MRAGVLAVFVVVWAGLASADPSPPVTDDPSPRPGSTAPGPGSSAAPPGSPVPPAPVFPATAPDPGTAADPTKPGPWIDLGATNILTAREQAGNGNHKLAASLTLGGLYLGFSAWTYLAWYRHHKALSKFTWGGDGDAELWSDSSWLSTRQYAGGADKFGHLWATMSLARLSTEMLHQWGGYDEQMSSVIGSALADTLFLGVEVKDGFYYEFSYGDFAFDTIGALVALAMTRWPRLDELFDFRVEYWPSAAYVRQIRDSDPQHSNLNIAEDYSGETYLLAFHLGAIHTLRDRPWGAWSQFVDVVLGFDSRGYKPEPPPGADPYPLSQHKFIGLSLNAQGLFDYLLDGRSRAGRKITHGLFEVFNLPFTSVRVLENTAYPDGSVMMGGA